MDHVGQSLYFHQAMKIICVPNKVLGTKKYVHTGYQYPHYMTDYVGTYITVNIATSYDNYMCS